MGVKQSVSASILLASSGFLPGQTPLCAGLVNGPTIADPTAASCVYDAAADAAVITFNREVVLDWQRVDQRPGSSLTFNFNSNVENATVLNRLGILNPRLGDHRFAGTLTSNGRVVILSPQTGVSLSGTITAGEFVTVVSEISPEGERALLQGDQAVDFAVDLSANPTATTRLLTVSNAQITSTSGDVVLGAARSTNILSTSSINSAGATRVFSGNRVNYDPAGNNDEQITPLPRNQSNAVLQSGSIASGTDVEISAADAGEILVSGPISARNGNGRIFLRVNNGTIDVGSNVILAGTLETTGAFQSVLFEGNEGDTPATNSPSVALFPSLRKGSALNRKDERSKSVQVFQGAPVVASSEASRQQGSRKQRVAQQKKKSSGALVQRSGFFGLRSAKVSKR